MTWAAVMVAFVVSHLVGDMLFQTEWQARNKPGGLGRDPVRRRALLVHCATYTLAFVPALVWIADERSAAGAAALGALIFFPHVAVDHGTLVPWWMRAVKHCPEPLPAGLAIVIDQSIHAVALLAVALLATA